MRIKQQQHGAVTVLSPLGPLHKAEADEFRQRVAENLAKSLGRIVVDVAEVPFVDSDGLEALLDVSDDLAKTGQTLRLCGANETLREVFELTGLAGSFEYFGDVNDATRSFL